ncbi:multicomponent Na+:H+ antiporter subunit F [Roseibium hamelinense]|uniref:Multicomponent Na+:H+ antiporter subunit F n=1 Tax=Roseibium hamelinense TaxID=150831 RepID=A0A562TIP1_9HYPH|nr:cation:proton antiporter [Roseibium hamelinense]MTI42658.1 sodium:proton antiporter [Roseibium hamelinense]TWI93283.1 multicomponent Na+:H+ antiporter subunit F [Roseibium hamelinense]
MTPIEVFSSQFLSVCVHIALAILSVSFILICIRTIKGPSLPDRVVALDMLVAVGIGFLAVFGILSNYPLYIDVAITLGLVGFLATVAFARFILNRGTAHDPTIVGEVKESIARQEAGE